MRFLLKSLPVGIGLILVLAGVVALFLATQLTRSVRTTLERSLSYIYQTDVRIDKVAFVLSQGDIDLEGVTIYNPKPFKEGPAIEIGRVHADLAPSTLLSSKPVVRTVTLHDARVHMRLEAGVGTNLGHLEKNASRLSGGADIGAPATARREFVIQEFRSEAARVEFSTNILPVSSVGMDVQPFTMTELSGAKPVSTIDVCILFVRNVLQEGISIKGVLGPVADRLFGNAPAATNENESEPVVAE